MNRGFTLIELLIVIAIIAILGTLAIVTINPLARINASKDAQAFANVSTLGKTFEACVYDRIAGQGHTAASATDDCCGATDTGLCVSDATHGLAFNKYGYSGGFPVQTTVNRGAAGTNLICIAQVRGSDTKFIGYAIGGGTVVSASTGGCFNGILQP